MQRVVAIALVGAALADVTWGDASEKSTAYAAGPFAFLSLDYFARFSRNPDAVAVDGEVTIESDWEIVVQRGADPLVAVMAKDLSTFLDKCMGLGLPIREDDTKGGARKTLFLSDREGGVASSIGSFTIRIAKNTVTVQGRDPSGLRDGIVQLVDRMGFRAAPILAIGEGVLTPRLGLRVGTVPKMGSYRDLVFMGYNAVTVSPTDSSSETQFTALSTSNAIPELTHLQDPELVRKLAEKAREARGYGLKTFIALQLWDFYPADAPIFENHPGLRGAEAFYHTDRPPAGHLLCTEAPLMRRYLAESIKGIFKSIPLDGALIIVGGEVFQHCFMRPTGVERTHTNCARCEKLGAETVVANLCNGLATAARESNPEAVVVAWPYSAHYFWSADDNQLGFISHLKPGTALLTEIEKDATIHKEDGIDKAIWDYSIDLIGPTDRAKRQIAACKNAGVAVYLKSEPELAFEAPGLPYIPCLDRWFDRADALAASGADGAWVLAWFVPNLGTTSAEIYKYASWNPAPDREALLNRLARRIAGADAAASHLRRAWAHASEAIAWSPELPPYFSGPYYLGPLHPMCADPAAPLPPCFQAKSQFASHVLTEARGDLESFGRYYRNMENVLYEAVKELDAAAPEVPERCRRVFQAEELPTRWFYHTARTHANFYESCKLREALLALAARETRTPDERTRAQAEYDRWREVLEDERENTKAAIAVVEQDPRLDPHNTASGAALDPAADLMRAKLDLLEHELDEFLPSVARKCELTGKAAAAAN